MRRACCARILLEAGAHVATVWELRSHQVVTGSYRLVQPAPFSGALVQREVAVNDSLVAPIEARTDVDRTVSPPVHDRATIASGPRPKRRDTHGLEPCF